MAADPLATSRPLSSPAPPLGATGTDTTKPPQAGQARGRRIAGTPPHRNPSRSAINAPPFGACALRYAQPPHHRTEVPGCVAKRTLSLIAAAVAATALVAVGARSAPAPTRSPAADGLHPGDGDLGDKHPEAGVWVIAETDDLPTPYRKIVVTNDKGRFVIPELPEAEYRVWVRGYGLRDSAKIPARSSARGRRRASPSRPRSPPRRRRRRRTTRRTTGCRCSSRPMNTRGAAGRARPARLDEPLQARLPALPPDGLVHRARHARQPGGARRRPQEGGQHERHRDRLGRDALLDALADWGGRIAAGEVPEAPPRPKGIERNFVITQWAWGDLYTYAHDEIATDKRNPRLYPDGQI